MPSNMNPKIIDSLSLTVRSSIPIIRSDIERFLQDESQFEALENAYHNVHPIKDVAEMLGLSVLQHIAQCIAEMIEEIATRPVVDAKQRAWLYGVIDQVEPYLDSILCNDGHDQDILCEAIKFFRRFKGLPESEDTFYIQEILSTSMEFSNIISSSISDTNESYGDISITDDFSELQMDNFSSELLKGFLLEAEDYLDIIGRSLPNLSSPAKNHEQLLQVRRSVHTLKGSSGIVGLQDVSKLSHRMEDLLDELYEGQQELTPIVKDLLCATFDVLEDFLRDKGAQGELDSSVRGLYDQYEALLGGDPAEFIPMPTIVESEITAVETEVLESAEGPQENAPAEILEEAPASTVPVPSDMVRVPIKRLDELVRLVGEMAISRSVYEQHLARLTHRVEELYLSIERLQRTATTIETGYEVSALVGAKNLFPAEMDKNLSRSGKDWTGIIEFDELEFDRYSEFHLMSRDLSETSADIGALGSEFRESLGEFDSYLTRQSRLTSEIQDKLMECRMVPLSSMTTRLQRAVRVTARQRNKAVGLTLEGEAVTFDKSMLEEMHEALLHLLRNSVDHGIESEEIRKSRGKSPQGMIHLQAFREGTQIVMRINDDGGGLNPQQLRVKAIQNGLLSVDEADQWRDEELYPLIFTPGFSTASEVSEVSGRGVGMDIVYTTVSRLKGRITVDSTVGEGVTFIIRLPLTLALARVLLVQVQDQTFAIPLADVTQVINLEPQELEHIGESQVIRLGGKVLPVIYLEETLGIPKVSEQTDGRLSIVMTQAGEKQVAFVVDQLLGGREIVVKTLGEHLRHVHGIAGSTLMGDGSIVLILNPSELVQDKRKTVAPKMAKRILPALRNSEAFDILVVDDSFSVRRVVANLVKSAGWQPILAKNGLEALEIIQRSAELPDLVLLDVEMPQMDGFELTSTLRANAVYRKLPIVMLTSRSGDKHRRKAYEVGATDYVVKPYQDTLLLELIRRLVVQARGTTAA